MVRNYKRKTDRVYVWKTPRIRSWDKIYEAKREAKKELLEVKRMAYQIMLEEARLETERIEAFVNTIKCPIAN